MIQSTDSLSVWREVQAENECDHSRWEYRRQEAVNGSEHFYKQCLVCGQRKRVKKDEIHPTRRAEAGEVDDGIADAWTRHLRSEVERRLDARRHAEKEEWDTWYAQYLETSEWKHRRQLVLKRASGICEGCGEAMAAVVHHLTYDRVGHEMLYDLVALCRNCHDRVHGRVA